MRGALVAACLLAALTTEGVARADVAATATVVLPAPAHINHAPTLIETAPGRLIACWYAGADEAGPDVSIVCARSDTAGRTWQALPTAARPGEKAAGAQQPNKTLGNPVLFLDPTGRLWLIHGVVQSRPTVAGNVCRNWRCSRIDARHSEDNGATWSAPVRLIDLPGALPRAHVLLVDGLPFLPFYLEGDRTSRIATLDLGGGAASVRAMSPIVGPDIIQPALVTAGPHRVRAYFRDRRARRVFAADFDATRNTWSTPQPLNLPNPDSAVEALAAPGGGVILVYNPSQRTRASLALAYAADGLAFDRGCTLVSGLGDVAYPSALLLRDGALALSYSARGKREIRFALYDRAAVAACIAQPLG